MRAEARGEAELRQLYDEHAELVRCVLSRLLGRWGDADDLMQEVFVIAWRRRNELQVENPRAWLCGIAVRLASAHRRRAWLRSLLRLDGPEQIDWRSPDRLFEMDEAGRRVHRLLERLSEKKRSVFVLYEIHGLNGPEIAEALGCPLKTVWSRLMHARREFLAQLEAEGGPDEKVQS